MMRPLVLIIQLQQDFERLLKVTSERLWAEESYDLAWPDLNRISQENRPLGSGAGTGNIGDWSWGFETKA